MTNKFFTKILLLHLKIFSSRHRDQCWVSIKTKDVHSVHRHQFNRNVQKMSISIHTMEKEWIKKIKIYFYPNIGRSVTRALRRTKFTFNKNENFEAGTKLSSFAAPNTLHCKFCSLDGMSSTNELRSWTTIYKLILLQRLFL